MSFTKRDENEILASGLFNAAWYSGTYPDVALTGMGALEHYLRIGRHLGRSPGPDFDSGRYLAAHEDVAIAKIDPVQHYSRHGRRESRQTFPSPAPLPGKKDFRKVKGKIERRPGRPTVMLCAHVAGQQLFGSERSLLDMLDALDALDFNVVITVPAVQNIEYFETLLAQAMAAYVIPYGWWRKETPLGESVVASFCTVIAAESVEVVHVNTIMLREPLLAARRMGVRGIVHIRELIHHDTALLSVIGEPADEIVARIWDNADLLIANSLATRKGFEHAGRVPEVVYNTADMDALRALDPPGGTDPVRVALVSSNIPKKGLWQFCEIARDLYADHPEMRFCLIGPLNDNTRQISEQISAGTLPPSIELLGYRSTPAEAIAEADVVLSLSSFQESFGRTVLEGMAAARPVIVYDHGAPPELLRDGESGFVVPAGDTAAVAARLRLLARDRARLERMGIKARAYAEERFGRTAYVAQMRAAYDRVLSGDITPQRMVLPARANLDRTPREQLRIAYFMWHFPVPSETFVLNELRLLRAMGIDVRVFCRQSPYPDFKPDFDIEWERIRDKDHLAQRLVETGRTIVHAHFIYPTVTEMVWPACEIAGIPFTCIAHAQDIFRYKNAAVNRIDEFSRSPLCRKIFTLSRFHHRYLESRGVPAEKLMINSNCVDPDLFAPGKIPNRPARNFRSICAVSRFAEKKGLEHLIRAGALLEGDGITVNIYGYGELEDRYREILAQSGAKNVHLHGPVKGREALIEVFRQHDLFACPSVQAGDGDMDGIPTTLMEAISAGLPVLTTEIAGIPDLVQDSFTGFVCPAGPETLAAKIRGFYALPDVVIEGVMANAETLLRQNHNGPNLVDTLVRVWANETIDLMIVSWNNLPELAEVTRRLTANTSLPYHLIICDNGSRAATLAHLVALQAENDRVTLILNRENAFVGPGTNICLEHGRSDYAIYVCGREGMTLRKGWELPIVHHMNANPRVGQGGTLCYSPSYLHGRDYPTGVSLFDRFRNREFATQNPERVFSHVQGGFFVLRRRMIDEIGAFSTEVPHSYTDVEFSYYVESCGWELGEVPGLKALFNKTRPGLFHRVDETIGAVHPPTLADLPVLDAIARGELCHCTLCAGQFPAFIDEEAGSICPGCGADRRARSIYRCLVDSTLLFRRLPALGINLPAGLDGFWTAQFQGRTMSTEALVEALRSGPGRLDLNPGRLKVILLNGFCEMGIEQDMRGRVLAEMSRLLAPDGMLLLAGAGLDTSATPLIERTGFRLSDRRRYASRATHYDWHPVSIYALDRDCVGEERRG